MVKTFKFSVYSGLIYVMTLVSGKQKLQDVFQKIWMIITLTITLFLHFVTGQSLIVWMAVIPGIVQIEMKAVRAV